MIEKSKMSMKAALTFACVNMKKLAKLFTDPLIFKIWGLFSTTFLPFQAGFLLFNKKDKIPRLLIPFFSIVFCVL